MMLGTLALAMIGMIVIAPLIAELLRPFFDFMYDALHLDPSIIPASLFANDMGGAPLASLATEGVILEEKDGEYTFLHLEDDGVYYLEFDM